MATSKKSTQPEEEKPEEIQHGLEVSPSMPFYCTWLPGACPPGADKRTDAAIASPFTNPPMCPPHGSGMATVIPTFVPPCPTMPQICVQTINPACPKPQVQEEGQAITKTIITCTGIPIVCGAQPQNATLLSVPPICPTVPPMCPQMLSQVTACPTVAPMCPVTAQPQTAVTTTVQTIGFCPTTTVMGTRPQPHPTTTVQTMPFCPTTTVGGTQPQTFTGIPHVCPVQTQPQTAVTTTVQTMPFCPTVTSPVATCPPAGGAQAQGITGVICSILPTVCFVTQIAGCGNQANAQAQTLLTFPVCPPTVVGCPQQPVAQTTMATVCTQIMCPPGGAQAQGITVGALCSLLPPLCLVTQLAGCGQAGAQAQGAAIPTVGFCPPPITYVQDCGPQPTATATAQAQGITVGALCSLLPPLCLVTQLAGCGQAGAQAQGLTFGGICPQTIVACPPNQAMRTLATVCTQTVPPMCQLPGGPQAQAVGDTFANPACPHPTTMTQTIGGGYSHPPVCFPTIITQPFGACPPHTAQAQGFTGIICQVTQTITNTITITVTV